jgi:hypothetical protein
MKRNFGLRRHPYQPVSARERLSDFLATRAGRIFARLMIVVAAVILLIAIGNLRAGAAECDQYCFLRAGEAAAQAHQPHRHRARHARAPRAALDANGNTSAFVRSKAGAIARVASRYVARFQAYIDDLEAHGARILFMGGIRRGHCSSGSQHPCGSALDVCQLRRGVVDSRCRLPERREIARIAAAHGLFEGGRWCNSDYGHAQALASGGDCGARAAHRRRHRSHVERHEAPRNAF